MKTLLLVMLVVLFATTTKATNYYFSSVTGDDSRTSTEAKSSSTPWKTLSKLNSFFSSLQPGDSVLLKRGETFYGSLTINKSGTSTMPIVIGAYGTGNRPIITSLVTLGSWVAKGNGIYESYNSSLGTSVNLVLLNGIQQQIGRYPNSDADNKGYLIFESHVGTTSITDNEFASTTSWAGAELVVRPRRWVMDKSKITSNTATTISYSPALSCAPYDKMGYFIQNSIKTLDKFGEWYYDPATKKLNVYFGSNSPSSYTIQTTSIANLISSNNISNVVFDNLTIKGANENGVNIISGSNMTVKNCDILFSGKIGVIANMHDQFKIENSTISNSNNKGLDLGYSSDYAIVRSNKILNTGMIAGMSGNFDNSCIAIYAWGNGNTIEYNEIRNSGYDGMYINGSDLTIKNNLIDSFCLVKDDGAGIYSHAGTVVYNNRKITGNIIINGIGAGPGTDYPGNFPASGIYLDNNASEVEMTGNTIAFCNKDGLYIHNSFGMIIKNNTIFNNPHQVTMSQDADNVPIRNNVVTNNIFFSRVPSQYITYLKSSADDIGLFGRFDSNYYARPIDDRITIYNQYPGIISKLDLAGWKKEYNNDASSKITAKQIAAYRINSIIGSNRFTNGTFTSNASGIYGSSATVAFSTSGGLDGGCAQVTPTAVNSAVSVNIGAITAGKKYIVRFSIRGSVDDNTVATVYIKRTSPYAILTQKEVRKVGTTRTENEIMFLASSSETAAGLVLSTDQISKYYLDNIQVFEADASITNVDDSLRFEFNATKVNKTVALNGNYIDTRGNKFSNSITLLPYASTVLIKNDGIANTINVAPTVSITSPASTAKFDAPASITISATAADADGSVAKVDFYNGNTLLGSDNTSPYSFTWDSVSAGSYSLTARATDNDALVTASSAVAVSVSNPNVAPTVSITTPATGAKFDAPASITISATATDADGSIAKVDFYNGNTLLGSDNTSPYSFTWGGVAAGSYSITAKATDNGSLATTSSTITISVSNPNTAPTVSITTPVSATKFDAPASITISATAADADGSVTKVDFYNGTTLLGSDNTSPYSFTWNSVAAGNYSLTAKATDNDLSIISSAAVTISVLNPNEAPTVGITTPVTGAKFDAPASITISATAADADGSVAKVDFYNGNTLLGSDNTSPYSITWNNVAAGSYSLTAKATDNGSLATTSSTITISVSNPNTAPTVSITTPVSAKFDAPASITINATAADADGSVTKVDFYNGTTLLGSDNTSPYSFTWNNVAAGNYSLTAKATDNDLSITSSAAVTISVLNPNGAPTVSITSPVSNTKFDAPASITISVTAADADGSISKVDFYNGNTLLGSDNTSPYSFTWTNVAAGSYSLTAKATDNGSLATTSSTITISVSNPNTAPTVSITTPVSATKFDAPASITINATAADADGSVTKVDFYNGATLLGSDNTSPYSFIWNNVAAGNYSLIAKATDNDLSITSSAAVTISVFNPNGAPTVSITNPVANATFDVPASITINATAADADGSITRVDFYNGTTLLGSDNTSPYSFTWNNVAAGNYSLTAKATDNANASSTSTSVTVMVNSVLTGIAIQAETACTAEGILNDTAHAGFRGTGYLNLDFAVGTAATWTVNSSTNQTVSLAIRYANASANSRNMSLSVNKTVQVATVLFPFTGAWTTWNTTSVQVNLSVGRNVLQLTSLINEGAPNIDELTFGSSSVSATSCTIANQAPTVSISSPANNGTFTAPASISINATAADADGSITKVDFYNGNTLLGSDNSNPYSFTWTNVAAGSYSLTAKATDNGSLVTSSTAVTLLVSSPNLAPAVSITSPLTNAAFDAPASITISATAADADGSVTKVDFYSGNTLLGSDNTSPYSFTWSGVAAGSYTLTAKATDNESLVATSAVIYVSVSNPEIAPTVDITSPESNATFNTSTSVTINATATDADGSISKVEFYNGTTLLGSDNTSPYTFKWDSVKAGNYSLKAKAYDNDNLATTSTAVPVVVASLPDFAFKSFSGAVSGKQINLSWSTNNTGNTSYFRILRGKRRMSLKEIGRVSFVNSTSETLNYTFSDMTPLTGTNYYKIARVDMNGSMISSAIIAVDLSSGTLSARTAAQLSENQSNLKTMSLNIGPNPTSSLLSVFTNGLQMNKELKISVLSITGRVLKTIQTNSSNQSVQINVSSLDAGIYIVELVSGDVRVHKQFVKQ